MICNAFHQLVNCNKTFDAALTVFLAQIEENTRVLEKLGQRGGTAVGYASSTDDDRSVREGSISRKTQERWKVGAKKALLQWVQAQVGRWRRLLPAGS